MLFGIEVSGEAAAGVIVALIGGGTALAVGGLKLWGEFTKVRAALGAPNGNGSLTEMSTKLLAGQAGQDRRLAALESSQHHQLRRLDDAQSQLAQVGGRLDETRWQLEQVDERLADVERLAG